MYSAKRIDTILWLALLLACAVGGWRFGSSVEAPPGAAMADASPSPAPPPWGKSRPAAFPLASLRASWIERVKAAKPGEFPALVAEWKERFPEDDRYEDGRPPNAVAALAWVHGMWLANDPDGFFRALTEDSGAETIDPGSAAIAIVKLMPEKAAALFADEGSRDINRFFLQRTLSELARKHPELYLQLNDHARFSLEIEYRDSRDWVEAMKNLAKTDAPAAGNACLRWQLNPPDLFEGLKAVALAWKTGTTGFAAWANSIQDPYIRGIAHDARITVLAERDPMSALTELSAMDTDLSSFAMAKEEVLRRLAIKDPRAAINLLTEAEDYFFSGATKDLDFRDPFGPGLPDPGTNKMLSAFHGLVSSGSRSENNLRSTVLASIAQTLPDDPAELFAGMRQLTADLGRDASWQMEIERGIIASKHDKWSIEECSAAATQWADDYLVSGQDGTLRALAKRTVQDDPGKLLSSMDAFPEVMRPGLNYELILALPSSKRDQRADLLHQLPADFWDGPLGESLGSNAQDYAEVVAALPAAKSANFVSTFIDRWAEKDPETAARWLPTLSDPAASAEAARTLAWRWFELDGDGTAAWVNTLPEGDVRDAAVASIVSQQVAHEDPQDAWRWANTIANTRERVAAYDKIAFSWELESPPPPEFHTTHREARQQIGLPAYQKPANEDPFR